MFVALKFWLKVHKQKKYYCVRFYLLNSTYTKLKKDLLTWCEDIHPLMEFKKIDLLSISSFTRTYVVRNRKTSFGYKLATDEEIKQYLYNYEA